MTSEYKQHSIYKSPVDLARCRASVNTETGLAAVGGHRQCQRKAKFPNHPDGQEKLWCGQHDPERVKARDDARNAKHNREWEVRMWNGKRRNLALQAYEHIAILGDVLEGDAMSKRILAHEAAKPTGEA